MCDAARNWAPDLIGMDTEGRSFLITQPVGVEQEAELVVYPFEFHEFVVASGYAWSRF